MRSSFILLLFLYLIVQVVSVDRSVFHTSKSSDFYQRLASKLRASKSTWNIHAEGSSFVQETCTVTVPLVHTTELDMHLSLRFVGDAIAHVSIEEHEDVIRKYGKRFVPYETDMYKYSTSTTHTCTYTQNTPGSSIELCTKDTFGDSVCMQVSRADTHFVITTTLNGISTVILNSQAMFVYEQRPVSTNPKVLTSTYNKHTDTQPLGASAVHIDIQFPHHTQVYGLAEHASTYALKRTLATPYDTPTVCPNSRLYKHSAFLKSIPELVSEISNIPNHPESRFHRNMYGQWGALQYTEPYRLYNTDVFRYEVDEPMSLYGSIPYIITNTQTVSSNADNDNPPSTITAGVFFDNASDGYVDIYNMDDKHHVGTNWAFETGSVNMYLLVGRGRHDIRNKYQHITGAMSLPSLWSLGAHQCHWRYSSQVEALDVNTQMLAHDLPYDTLWLDIEHTDGKRYFTWDERQFPNHIAMEQTLATDGRHLVVIIDPHVKDDDKFFLRNDLLRNNLLIRDGNTHYQGKCWPGMSVYGDFMQPATQFYWSEQIVKHLNNTNVFIWNDMNELSVFGGPEATIPKHVLHCPVQLPYKNSQHPTTKLPMQGCYENREIHNVFGMYYHQANYNGLYQRPHVDYMNVEASPRPFVLTRAFYAGTQRSAAIWTGDNAASWSHMHATTPMMLSLAASGVSFVGSDLGGFFDVVDGELLARWYQIAILHPFHRNHGNIEVPRREPYLFDDLYYQSMRRSLRMRYNLLNHLYTAMRVVNVTGQAGIYSLHDAYPLDTNALVEDTVYGMHGVFVPTVAKQGMQHAYMYHPLTPNVSSISSTLTPAVFVDYYTGKRITSVDGTTLSIPSSLTQQGIILTSGASIIHNEIPKRHAKSTTLSPYTFTIVPNTHTLSIPTALLTLYNLHSTITPTTKVLSHGFVYTDDHNTHAFAHTNTYSYTHVLTYQPTSTFTLTSASASTSTSTSTTKVPLITLVTTPTTDVQGWKYIPTSCYATSLATDTCIDEFQRTYNTPQSQEQLIHLTTTATTPTTLTKVQDKYYSYVHMVRLLKAAASEHVATTPPTRLLVLPRTDGQRVTQTYCETQIEKILASPDTMYTHTMYPFRNGHFIGEDKTSDTVLRAMLGRKYKLNQELCIAYISE